MDDAMRRFAVSTIGKILEIGCFTLNYLGEYLHSRRFTGPQEKA